jgi:uncharacterized protein (TIGR00369 family)
MEDLLELGREILASQPFSELVGAELTSFSTGEVTLSIPVTSQHKQQHGFVHGGVVSYAADNALTFVGGSVLGPAVVTSEYKINYVRPATGDKLIAKGSVIYASRTKAVCRCDIFAMNEDEEKLCAVSQGTIETIGETAKDQTT